MLQSVDGHPNVYVVEFDTMPELPITWSTEEEKPYALALAHAIHNETITEPGKYGLVVDDLDDHIEFTVFKIIE